MQTADSNTHSHQRCCVTATSRTHHPSAPNCCFHHASTWTHPTSKDGALHFYISPAATVSSACAATPLLSSTSRSRLRGQSSQVQRSTCTGVFNTTEVCMGGPSRYRPKLRPSHWKLQQPSFSQAACRSLIPPAPLCSDKDGRPSVLSKPNTSAQVRM